MEALTPIRNTAAVDSFEPPGPPQPARAATAAAIETTAHIRRNFIWDLPSSAGWARRPVDYFAAEGLDRRDSS
jgi:hypothetical protein